MEKTHQSLVQNPRGRKLKVSTREVDATRMREKIIFLTLSKNLHESGFTFI